MNNMFSKSVIKAGYLLVCHDIGNNTTYNATVNYGSNGELAACCPKYVDFFPISLLEDDLTRIGFGVNMCVMEVYGTTSNAHMLDNSTDGRQLLWKRQVPKKMTVEEIEKILGYKIEIVSDNDK